MDERLTGDNSRGCGTHTTQSPNNKSSNNKSPNIYPTTSPSKTKKGKDICVPTLLFIHYLPRCKEPMATYFSNKLLALMP